MMETKFTENSNTFRHGLMAGGFITSVPLSFIGESRNVTSCPLQGAVNVLFRGDDNVPADTINFPPMRRNHVFETVASIFRGQKKPSHYHEQCAQFYDLITLEIGSRLLLWREHVVEMYSLYITERTALWKLWKHPTWVQALEAASRTIQRLLDSLADAIFDAPVTVYFLPTVKEKMFGSKRPPIRTWRKVDRGTKMIPPEQEEAQHVVLASRTFVCLQLTQKVRYLVLERVLFMSEKDTQNSRSPLAVVGNTPHWTSLLSALRAWQPCGSEVNVPDASLRSQFNRSRGGPLSFVTTDNEETQRTINSRYQGNSWASSITTTQDIDDQTVSFVDSLEWEKSAPNASLSYVTVSFESRCDSSSASAPLECNIHFTGFPMGERSGRGTPKGKVQLISTDYAKCRTSQEMMLLFVSRLEMEERNLIEREESVFCHTIIREMHNTILLNDDSLFSLRLWQMNRNGPRVRSSIMQLVEEKRIMTKKHKGEMSLMWLYTDFLNVRADLEKNVQLFYKFIALDCKTIFSKVKPDCHRSTQVTHRSRKE